MSVNFEKLAQLTSPEILLLSALAGSGTFAGMRYLTDLGEKISPPKAQKNTIKLDLHNPLATQEMSSQSVSPMAGAGGPQLSKAANANIWLPYLSALAGAPIGFLGTKAMYDQHAETQDNHKLDQVKKQYQQQLLAAQQLNKVGTPIVDGLCEALASEMEKDANFVTNLMKNHPGKLAAGAVGASIGAGNYLTDKPVENAAKLAPGMFGLSKPALPGVSQQDILSLLPKHDPAINSEIQDNMSSQALWSGARLANTASAGFAGGGLNIWGALTGGTVLGTLGLLLHHHNKKKEKEQEATYPTSVEYAK